MENQITELNSFSHKPINVNNNANLVDVYKNLFYQCNFNQIINEIDACMLKVDSISDYYKLVMIKAKAYFELNRREMANGCLEDAVEGNSLNRNADYYYTKGSLHYFKGDFGMAKTYFKSMLEFNGNKECVYKSLLAMGNIAYSEGKNEEASEYLSELKQLNLNDSVELRISYNHLMANVLISSNSDLVKAKELLEESYEISVHKNWNFFSQRSLYNLAKFYKKTQKVGESLGILSVLDMNLKTTDSRFLSLLVNKEFDSINHKSTQKVELNIDSKVIAIGNEDVYSLDLSRWPILFNFVKLLYGERGFISKEKIAKNLWPTQKYLPRTHDPRIYDVVKRVKKRLEVLENSPLLFEANSGGYRLNIS